MNLITLEEVEALPIGDAHWTREGSQWSVVIATSGTELFRTTDPSSLDAQLHAYSAGLLAGIESGRKAQQQEIRDALGLA